MQEKQPAARFVAVDDAAALDAAIEHSSDRPVLLLNYDPYCPINRVARGELSKLDVDVHVVDVYANHDLGELVEQRTGVRHESPQLIVLRGGRPVWSASHFAITAAGVTEAVSRS